MKKIVVGIFASMMLLSTSSVSAQVVQEGNMLFDLYYGSPTLFQRIFRAAVEEVNINEPSSSVDYRGSGPLGVRFEYLVSDQIGVGIDIGYNKLTVTNTRVDSVYNSSTNSNTAVVYDDVITSSKVGVMGTVNFHLVDNEKFDLAAQIGIGYGVRNYTFDSDDSDFDQALYNFGGIVWPFAMKAGFEARYFFIPEFGINMGLGLGQGGLIHGGISIKL